MRRTAASAASRMGACARLRRIGGVSGAGARCAVFRVCRGCGHTRARPGVACPSCAAWGSRPSHCGPCGVGGSPGRWPAPLFSALRVLSRYVHLPPGVPPRERPQMRPQLACAPASRDGALGIAVWPIRRTCRVADCWRSAWAGARQNEAGAVAATCQASRRQARALDDFEAGPVVASSGAGTPAAEARSPKQVASSHPPRAAPSPPSVTAPPQIQAPPHPPRAGFRRSSRGTGCNLHSTTQRS